MNGKQVPLGVTDPDNLGAAWAALHKLLADVAEVKAIVTPTVSGKAGTVADLVPAFLEARTGTIEPRTVVQYAQHLRWLIREFGTVAVAALDLAEVVKRARVNARWCDTHRANVLGTANTFLKWCGRPDVLPLPPRSARGGEAVIPDELYAKCLHASAGDFRNLLRFLWLTGCRPGEATGLTVEAVGWESSTAKIKQHKTRRKGKLRTLYFDAATMAVLQEQRARYDGGLLFRGVEGRRLGLSAMTMRFERLSDRVGQSITSYQFRHTWATRALARGLSDTVVATMLGHSSTAMIHRHYSHIGENAKLLKDAAEMINKAS